ncbi:MAG TPA: PaaI family thioesterase [Caulobacterales bacterium]|nr:PaaI family thioesterase [Caulobacterales bacterium]
MSADGAANEVYGRPFTLTEGPFAGWTTWSKGADPYETLLGPFCSRIRDGKAQCAFEPRRDHLNGGGAIHGGALMSFADFALFSIAHNALAGGVKAVTLTCNCEFISAGTLDGWIEAEGDVLRSTRSLVFVRGLVTQRARPVLAFSGALKKIGV